MTQEEQGKQGKMQDKVEADTAAVADWKRWMCYIPDDADGGDFPADADMSIEQMADAGVEEAQELVHQDEQDAAQVHPLTAIQMAGPESHEPSEWAAWLIEQIRVAGESGLPAAYRGEGAYRDTGGFLADFWGGDMPWTPRLALAVLQAMSQHEGHEAARLGFLARFGVDFWGPDGPEAAIQEALQEAA